MASPLGQALAGHDEGPRGDEEPDRQTDVDDVHPMLLPRSCKLPRGERTNHARWDTHVGGGPLALPGQRACRANDDANANCTSGVICRGRAYRARRRREAVARRLLVDARMIATKQLPVRGT